MPVYLYHFAFRSLRRHPPPAFLDRRKHSISDRTKKAVAAIKQNVARAVHGAGDALELVVHHLCSALGCAKLPATLQRSSCAITRAVTRALSALVRDSGALLASPQSTAVLSLALAIGARRRLGAFLSDPLRTTRSVFRNTPPAYRGTSHQPKLHKRAAVSSHNRDRAKASTPKHTGNVLALVCPRIYGSTPCARQKRQKRPGRRTLPTRFANGLDV